MRKTFTAKCATDVNHVVILSVAVLCVLIILGVAATYDIYLTYYLSRYVDKVSCSRKRKDTLISIGIVL